MIGTTKQFRLAFFKQLEAPKEKNGQSGNKLRTYRIVKENYDIIVTLVIGRGFTVPKKCLPGQLAFTFTFDPELRDLTVELNVTG